MIVRFLGTEALGIVQLDVLLHRRVLRRGFAMRSLPDPMNSQLGAGIE